MSIGAYARASLVVIATLVSYGFASSETGFDPVFPDGTILPASLSLSDHQPFFPEVDVPVVPKAATAVKTVAAKPSPKPAQSTADRSKPSQPVVRKATSAATPARPQVAQRASTSRTRNQQALRTLNVRSTGYNSLTAQTDRTPHVTATGARTRFGIIAVSRDLLRTIPYGSRVRLEDMGSWSGGGRGKYNRMLSDMVFVVEDTMHPRKSGTIDVWFPARRQAIQWGVRRLRVTVLQLGR
jgi:3D (Asp-Asp-Asp) domain-containing protein